MYLRNPFNSIGILVAVALLFEGLTWAVAYRGKMVQIEELGGGLTYVSLLLRGLFLPEICTLYILITLINAYHTAFRINSLPLNWSSITHYQLRLLPVLLLAFFVFNPFTQSVRFLTEAFPYYSFDRYLHHYLLGTFNVRMYILYLTPVVIIGYLAVNGSLVYDYFNQRPSAAESTEATRPLDPTSSAGAAIATPIPEYLETVKSRNAQGDMILPVDECLCFTIEDRNYYVLHPKGRYMLSKTLNELETELDPAQFFRINRGIILNRQVVQSYAHWEKGKYIVRLNIRYDGEVILPRARLQEFRDWLAGKYQPVSPPLSSPTVSLPETPILTTSSF
ncbi:LytTR family DNA-binding domain-containing protein [Nibrella viscosa]|uniref:LytTR family DNA-binding domain-containing protein n=1 Tax=Nibrella viscosa TaxID=1084524 RepID=UPI0031E7EC4A